MLSWFKETLAAAGFAKFGLFRPICVLVALPTLLAGFIFTETGIPAFAFSLAIGSLALEFEVLSSRAKARRKLISKVWPEVLDSLISASSSGLSLVESFHDLAKFGPALLKPSWTQLSVSLDSGAALMPALRNLQRELSEVHVDRLVALTEVVIDAGGKGFHESLRRQSKVSRDDLALWGELESKQGWVAGTAKVAITAPWIIVALLCSRPENAQLYSTPVGSMVLIVGLGISAFAYQVIKWIGSSRRQPRVFAP